MQQIDSKCNKNKSDKFLIGEKYQMEIFFFFFKSQKNQYILCQSAMLRT